MIQRFERQRSVAEVVGRPRNSIVAGVAFFRGDEMPSILSSGNDAVVTRGARPQHLGVVNGIDRHPHVGVMAVLADVGRLYMGRTLACGISAVVTADAVVNDIDVIKKCRQPGDGGVAIITVVTAGDMRRMFARGNGAVMAGAASTNDLGVIHCVGRCPGNVVMAVLTHIGGLDVRRVLAGGFDAIVASGTVGHDIDVIKIRGKPCHGGMAVIALATSGYVRGVLARRNRAVVTGITRAQYLRVIDGVGWCPDDVVVAILANIGGLNVRWVLARRTIAVVTRGAAADDTGMIEVRREPCHRGMAIITVFAAGDVGGILARGDGAVMAGTTGAQHLRMVDHVCRCPQVTVVAVFTNFCGLDMRRVLAGRFDAVMATGTVGHNVSVIKGRREPSRRRMTVVAIVATREVRRVLA